MRARAACPLIFERLPEREMRRRLQAFPDMMRLRAVGGERRPWTLVVVSDPETKTQRACVVTPVGFPARNATAPAIGEGQTRSA